MLAAGDSTRADAANALEELCRTYWPPLYAYVRHRGYPPTDAEDLTQQFFARLLAHNSLASADPARGRFRTFLLTSLQRFLISEWRRAVAQRRDLSQVVPLEPAAAESLIAPAGPGEPPELGFDRCWADTLLRRALDRLQADYEANGRRALYEALKPFVWGERSGAGCGEIAAELRLSEGAARVAVHRLRSRFRELLRAEVALTVADEADVDAELRHLVEILVRT